MTKSTRRDFLKTAVCVSGTLLAGPRCHAAESFEVGRPYAGWGTGEMDIHVIYTGRGESLFHIFPDGTSMLIDAGDWKLKNGGPMPNLPDTSRLAGEWVARYIERVNPSAKHVDYMMLSHYHPDHGGQARDGVEMTAGRGEDYALTGLAQVGELLTFDTAFDRGYPDYETPVPVVKNKTAENFRKYAAWAMKEKGLSMEKFEPGRLDQIALRHDASYDFHIRNLTANGIFWTGVGEETHNLFPDWKEEVPKENPLSLSLTIQYGAFRYYTGGDLDTASHYEDGTVVPIEAAAGAAAGPVDVCKANHHVSNNASTDEFVRAVQARAYLSTVWVDSQPGLEAAARLLSREHYTGRRKLFPTLVSRMRRDSIAEQPWKDDVALDGGHIVLKVFDSGRQYKIYYLTAEDESMRVKAVYGPFASTGTARYDARKA
ncbi:MAG: hypothetical protein IJJ20_07945 [Thermoguttaceae bacterium]|nr:hypothetical protein [Thermoguttaceae bacterium]